MTYLLGALGQGDAQQVLQRDQLRKLQRRLSPRQLQQRLLGLHLRRDLGVIRQVTVQGLWQWNTLKA